jgi:hypothetical protein
VVIPSYYIGRLASHKADGYTDEAIRFTGEEKINSILPVNSMIPGGYYYEFEYYAKQTGALIGESIINNKAGVGIGVGGKDYYHETQR